MTANGGILMTNGGQFVFKFLDGRTLNNAGTAVWNAGNVIAFNGAVINNLPGATFKAQSGYDLIYGPLWGDGGVGPRATFHNEGTFVKTGDTPPNYYEFVVGTGMDLYFENSGTVEALDGTLGFHSYTQTAGITELNGGAISSAQLDIQGGTSPDPDQFSGVF